MCACVRSVCACLSERACVGACAFMTNVGETLKPGARKYADVQSDIGHQRSACVRAWLNG